MTDPCCCGEQPKPEKDEQTDPVKRSLEKPGAFAKPGTLQNRNVRIRLTTGDKSLRRKKKRKHDPRDVTFY